MIDVLSGGSAGPPELFARQAAQHWVEFPVAPTGDPGWLLVEEGFTLAREHEVESLFAIGNGYVGSRGSLAEGSALSAPATFVAGVFDSEPGSMPGLAPTADWTRLSATIDGHPLRLDRGHNLEHRRILDMRQGILLEGVATSRRSRSDHAAANAAPCLLSRPSPPGSMCDDHARKLTAAGYLSMPH